MDRYALKAPGWGSRSCRRADGGPKIKYPQGLAEETAAALNRSGEYVHAYECPVADCGAWHIGHIGEAA